MSYTQREADNVLSYSPLDIAALQYLYGPSKSVRTGNDTYALKTTEANFIWDAVGTDTVTAAGASQAVTLYLEPGFWSYFGSKKASTITSAGQITINFGSSIENAVGTSYADLIFGSALSNSIEGGDGADNLLGAVGNDTLVGGPDDDTLSGGEGDDTAIFTGASSEYTITATDKATASLSIDSRTEGTDKLSGIEFVKFSDKTIATSAYFDQTPPTIAITSNKAALKAGDTALISFTLSKAATDFTLSDVTVSGGTITNFAGSGTNYTATFTPTANSTANGVVSIASGKFSDAAGNFNADGVEANNTVTMSVDTVLPTIALTTNKALIRSGETTTITFTLSESSTDFTSADVTVTGGTLSNFTGSGTSYTAVFTPTANSTANGIVSVASGKFSDEAGNFNADGAEANNTVTMTVDTVVRVVQFSSTASSANEGNSGNTTITVLATLSAASNQTVTVPITYSGTATSGSDYNNASSSITISAGQTAGSATFSVLGDTTSESNETVVVTLGTPTNATLGANTTFTHTIVNDDMATTAPAQPSGVFLSEGNHIALGSALVNVYGEESSVYGKVSSETVMLGAGASQVVLDQNVDQVYLSAAPSAYRFQQTGIRLDGYAAGGNGLLFSVALQNDADGSVLVFPGGSASAKVSAAGMILGGATVSSSAPAVVSPTLSAYVAPPSGPSTAGVFLGQGANFTAASTGLKLYGASGGEAVTLTRGVSDITMDQSVERVQFDGLATSALKFQQQGISLLVFDGTTLLAKVPLQTDADGTLITTTTGTMQAKVSAAGMFLGGALVNANTATTLIPTVVDTSLKASTEGLNVTITGSGSYAASAGDVTFTLEAIPSSFNYTIAGFGIGDKITRPFGVPSTIVDQTSFTDGLVALQFASRGNIVKITLTGLTVAQDSTIFTVDDLNSLFGSGTFGYPKLSDEVFAAVAVTGPGSSTESTFTNTTYTVAPVTGSYEYLIAGFGAGDKIVGPGGMRATVGQSSFTDGSIYLQYASGGNVVKITLTGLTAAQDSAIFGASDLNTVFGPGTLS